MSTYRFVVDIEAPRERVFNRWTDVERSPDWIEGLTRVTDLSGPPDEVGTTYVAHFGSWSTSTTTVMEAERPRWLKVRFGTWLLRGVQSAQFDVTPSGTRLTQTFNTVGLIPAVTARIFATGSYKGSFRGELTRFKEICEEEARAGGHRDDNREADA